MAYVPISDWSEREVKRARNGYVLIKVPEHPKSFKGWYYEHRLVMEHFHGRLLEHWEEVHHILEDKSLNVVDNLFLCVRREHHRANRAS